MREPVAWCFNLDADLELAAVGEYRTTGVVAKRIEDEVERIAATLPPGDMIVGAGSVDGLPGRAWCPTPNAIRRLSEAGAIVGDVPDLSILRTVNARQFAHGVAHFDDAVRVGSMLELAAAVARPGTWLLKREHSFAGRQQRKVTAALDDTDRAWAEASWPVTVEPRVRCLLEVGLHGALGAKKGVERGEPTIQRVDSHGQWRQSRLARPDELDPEELRSLRDTFEAVGDSLRAAGYFGPFGIDALRYQRDGDTRAHFHPLLEINARYSMGWPIGMGGWR